MLSSRQTLKGAVTAAAVAMTAASAAAQMVVMNVSGDQPISRDDAEIGAGKMARAGNAFAVDLYKQLSKENADRNLFFSPYSISIALVMTAEGARGETALQMGTVLHFPQEARRAGDDTLPWNMPPVHGGIADLGRQLTGSSVDEPDEIREIRRRIEDLEQEHERLRKENKASAAKPPFAWEAGQRDRVVVGELNRLRQRVDQYELRVANALWCAETFPFRKEFLVVLDEAYGAAANAIDFKRDPEAARARINRWVEQQTNDRIRELLAQGTVTPCTVLVLTNAVYFKGNWADEFNKSRTKEADFTLSDGTGATVMMMAAPKLEARYAEVMPDGTFNGVYRLRPNPDGFQVLELRYRGGDLSMVVLLPKRHDGLAALESMFTPEALDRWIGGMKKRKVNVFLPKFKMETTYKLPKMLSAMGMPAAFGPGGFTGVSDSAAARLLYISEVVHKAFIDVNEQGTEAAAATGVTMTIVSARIDPPTPTFRADRPFIFAIRHNQTGSILFLSRMANPANAL